MPKNGRTYAQKVSRGRRDGGNGGIEEVVGGVSASSKNAQRQRTEQKRKEKFSTPGTTFTRHMAGRYTKTFGKKPAKNGRQEKRKKQQPALNASKRVSRKQNNGMYATGRMGRKT